MIDPPEPRLVTPESRLAETVDGLQSELGEELGYRVTGWDEAWLWGTRDGYATFDYYPHRTRGALVVPDSAHWTLSRVWIAPALRRRGMLAAAWPIWRERYGEFEVEEPLSPAMRAFVGG